MNITRASHVDDFIRMHTHNEGEIYAAWLLMFHRLPAAMKLKFSSLLAPCKLFCTWQSERFEVVGASRLGDVWLKRLPLDSQASTCNFDHRAAVSECSHWSATVDGKQGLAPQAAAQQETIRELQLRCNRLSDCIHYLSAGFGPAGNKALQEGDLISIPVAVDCP